jgi:hypothetical protein
LFEAAGSERDGAGRDEVLTGRGNQLTPFVTNKMPRTYGQYDTKLGPIDPATYLARWKSENGLD